MTGPALARPFLSCSRAAVRGFTCEVRPEKRHTVLPDLLRKESESWVCHCERWLDVPKTVGKRLTMPYIKGNVCSVLLQTMSFNPKTLQPNYLSSKTLQKKT